MHPRRVHVFYVLSALILVTIFSFSISGHISFPLTATARAAEPVAAEPTAEDYIEQARVATDTVGNSYANSVRISGDTAVVSSTSGFYVYTRVGTTWAQQAVLIPSDGTSVLTSPYPIAIDEDTVVIGARTTNVNGNPNQGAAYVFVRAGTTWTEQARLTASDGAADDGFALWVSISGDTIISGSYRDDIGANADQGSAYIFNRNGAVWTEQAKLLADDGGSNENFGGRVAIDGEYAAISTGRNGVNQTPAVYIFARSGTIWAQQTKLSVCEPSANGTCQFGLSTAISGDTLAVANYFATIGSNTAAGAVYVFSRTGSVWNQQQRLIAPDGQIDDVFGSSVGIDGDSIVVGASAFNVRPGSAYVYSSSAGPWELQQKLQSTSKGLSNHYGISVSLSGNSFIVGSIRDNQNSDSPIGAAYLYARPSDVEVSVSGRVLTAGLGGLRSAVVSIIGPDGARRSVSTSTLGYYNFEGVPAGQTYRITIASKRYRFESRQIVVNSDLSAIDFVGLE